MRYNAVNIAQLLISSQKILFFFFTGLMVFRSGKCDVMIKLKIRELSMKLKSPMSEAPRRRPAGAGCRRAAASYPKKRGKIPRAETKKKYEN